MHNVIIYNYNYKHNAQARHCIYDKFVNTAYVIFCTINFRHALKLSNQWEIVYNRRDKKYKLVRKEAAFNEYVFYSVLNTDIIMTLGVAASTVRIKKLLRYISIFYNIKH